MSAQREPLIRRNDRGETMPASGRSGIDDQALIESMATAGQALAVRWGHQPWSDAWAHLVAETLLAEVISDAWRCECGDLNRSHEAFCYRCGAGQPEEDDA